MRLIDQPFVIVDTETTGLDPATDRVVEVGLARVESAEIKRLFTRLVDPGIPIPCTASAIHHITINDVAGKKPLEALNEEIKEFCAGAVLAAHNAPFDRSFLPMLADHKWLCTKRLAQHLWPDAPGFSNQVLRYFLELKVGDYDISPHRALSDSIVTAELFIAAVRQYLSHGNPDDIDALLGYAASPIKVKAMPFGKHSGKPITEIPRDYLRWALGNIADMDLDLRSTILEELNPKQEKLV